MVSSSDPELSLGFLTFSIPKYSDKNISVAFILSKRLLLKRTNWFPLQTIHRLRPANSCHLNTYRQTQNNSRRLILKTFTFTTVENFRFSGNWKYLRQKRGLALHHPVLLLCVQITKEKLHLITCLSENGLDRNRINQENMSIVPKNIFRYACVPSPKNSERNTYFSPQVLLNPWLN